MPGAPLRALPHKGGGELRERVRARRLWRSLLGLLSCGRGPCPCPSPVRERGSLSCRPSPPTESPLEAHPAPPQPLRHGPGDRARAARRPRAAAHLGSVAGRGVAAAHLRPLPAHRAAGGDAAPGRHRRHRRGQPQGARPMAVAAHHRRRPRHAGDADGRRRDRLRRRVLRSPTAARRRSPPTASAASTRRRGRKLKALPSNDAVLAEAIGRSRVVLGQTALAQASAPPEGEPLPQTGRREGRRSRSRSLVAFPGLLRNVPELELAAAGRGLFTIRPERDGIVRRVPIVMRAEATIVPSSTLEMLRVASRIAGDPVADRRGRHAGRRLARLRDPDRRQRAAMGAFRPS